AVPGPSPKTTPAAIVGSAPGTSTSVSTAYPTTYAAGAHAPCAPTHAAKRGIAPPALRTNATMPATATSATAIRSTGAAVTNPGAAERVAAIMDHAATSLALAYRRTVCHRVGRERPVAQFDACGCRRTGRSDGSSIDSILRRRLASSLAA